MNYECAIFAMTLYSYLEAFNTNARARAHTHTTAHPHAHKRPAHTHTQPHTHEHGHTLPRAQPRRRIFTHACTQANTHKCVPAHSDNSTCTCARTQTRAHAVSARRVCLHGIMRHIVMRHGIMRPGIMRRGVMRQYVV